MSFTSVFCRFPLRGSAGQRSARAVWEQAYSLHHHQHFPLVGLEATSKMQKGRNLGHNIAKITKISPFSAVTFFIYQNFPETNCENDFFITFTDYSVKRSKLIVYSYNLAYS